MTTPKTITGVIKAAPIVERKSSPSFLNARTIYTADMRATIATPIQNHSLIDQSPIDTSWRSVFIIRKLLSPNADH